MSPEITVETVATKLVAGLDFSTTFSSLPRDMSEAIGALQQHTADSAITVSGPVIAVYTDEMHPDRPWNCEVCVPVTDAFAEHPSLRCHELPGGTVATVTHQGAYTGLKGSYDAIFEWFSQHGHTYAGAPREIYLNGPDDVAETELLTRLEFPVVLASNDL
ncbi:GyrI-like domain-containing protein [Rhodoglobus sp. NPDC076762]